MEAIKIILFAISGILAFMWGRYLSKEHGDLPIVVIIPALLGGVDIICGCRMLLELLFESIII